MTIPSIISDLEKASGPDRNIDYMLHTLAHGGIGQGAYGPHPAYTTSADAALSLAERLLPAAYSLSMTIDPSGNGCRVHCWPNGLSGGVEVIGDGVSPTLPLAICLAALRTQEPQP